MTEYQISNLLNQLNSNETFTRNDAIKKIIKDQINDEQVIIALQDLIVNDSSMSVRNFARAALDVFGIRHSAVEEPIAEQEQEETNVENPVSTGQKETPSHSARGIISLLLPFIPLCGVISNYPAFSFMGSPTGSLFLYCICPVVLLIGLILAFTEIIRKDTNKLFPILGIVVTLIAIAPMLLEWLLGLMQGVPFSCLEDPTFCGW